MKPEWDQERPNTSFKKTNIRSPMTRYDHNDQTNEKKAKRD